MEQSSSEANNHSASQEIPFHVWGPKFHYRVHKSPLADIALSQMNPVYAWVFRMVSSLQFF